MGTKQWITPVINQKVDALLSRMTLEEKVGQMTQFDWGFYAINPDVGEDQKRLMRQYLEQGLVGSIFNISGVEEANEMQRMARENSRLGIPLFIARDVIHGYRTVFPIPLAQSASWNPQLVKRAAAVASREASTDGIAWVFAPMIDVTRDPRWGRIAESMGEDPYLTSVFAKAWVEGAEQNDWSDSPHVASSPKHFAAYGLAEAGRDYNTVDLSDRVLREVILPPFQEAVEAGALTIMASFNEVNGIPACANRYLLTTILREEWGFEGIVVSDYNAILELITHGVAENEEHACELAIKAGLDMDMHTGIYLRYLPKLVRDGRVPVELVDQAVRRILAVKFKLGLFEQSFIDTELKQDVIYSEPHLKLARELARESIVLLKNDKDILPLDKGIRSLAVIGPLADSKKDPLGCWAFDGREDDVVTILQGIKQQVSKETVVYSAEGCGLEGDSEEGFAEALTIAAKSDAAVLVMGEGQHMSGESNSRTGLDLPGKQKQLVQAILRLGKPVAVVLLSGRPLAIPWLQEEADVIVEAWHLGVQNGHAVSDVLFGDYNPSGKLTASFPLNTGQIPVYYYRKKTGRPPAGVYSSHYLDSPTEPLYPFGYGLSYTQFKYDHLTLSAERLATNEQLAISVTVSNTGSRAGEEVVQLYTRDLVASVTQPLKLLKGFRKISLQPGESQIVAFTLSAGDLAIIDAEMKLAAEPGEFQVWVGPNSVEGLTSTFTLV